MSFRISRGPHGFVWWKPDEDIPPGYQRDVRAATEPEIELINRAIGAAARGSWPSPALIRRLKALMEGTLV